MDTKKSNTDISIEDLLGALDNDVSDEHSTGNNVHDFVLAFDFKPGETKIKGALIFQLFATWNTKEKIGKMAFYQMLNKFFPQEDGRPIYWLNKEATQIFKHIEDQKKSWIPRAAQNTLKNKRIRINLERFIEEYGIKAGNLYIESDIFYHIYDTWCYKNRRNSMSYNRFVNTIMLFFKYKRLGEEQAKWFGLDESIKQHIDVEAVKNWRQGRVRRGKSEKYKVKEENIGNVIYPETQID